MKIAAASLLVALTGACSTPSAHVARGEAFATGNTTFDDFFTAVRDVRTDAQAAPGDAEGAPAALLKGLGLESKAPSKALEEAGQRAKKLQDKGILLHLEIAPEPKLMSTRSRADLGPDGETLLKATEGAARAALDLRKRLATIAARAADLEKRRADLHDQAATAFRDEKPAKRDEILAELDASKAVLADAGDGASHAAGAASRFVVELVQAVETGGGTGTTVAEPAKPGRGKKGGFVPKATGPRPAAPAGAPAAAPAAPKKKPKGGDDFEP